MALWVLKVADPCLRPSHYLKKKTPKKTKATALSSRKIPLDPRNLLLLLLKKMLKKYNIIEIGIQIHIFLICKSITWNIVSMYSQWNIFKNFTDMLRMNTRTLCMINGSGAIVSIVVSFGSPVRGLQCYCL